MLREAPEAPQGWQVLAAEDRSTGKSGRQIDVPHTTSMLLNGCILNSINQVLSHRQYLKVQFLVSQTGSRAAPRHRRIRKEFVSVPTVGLGLIMGCLGGVMIGSAH